MYMYIYVYKYIQYIYTHCKNTPEAKSTTHLRILRTCFEIGLRHRK